MSSRHDRDSMDQDAIDQFYNHGDEPAGFSPDKPYDSNASSGGPTAAKQAEKLKHNTHDLAKLGVVGIQKMLALVRVDIVLGLSDDEVMEKHNITRSACSSLRNEILQVEKGQWIDRSTPDIFATYLMELKRGAFHLDALIKRNLTDTSGPVNGPSAASIVAAVKARTEIYDSIIKRGQEFGIIEKVAEKKLVMNGHLVAEMSNATLRKLLQTEIHALATTQQQYGETDILGGTLPERLIEPPPPKLNKDGSVRGAVGGYRRNPSPEPVKPDFSANLKPGFAVGGLAKSAGAKAANSRRLTPAQQMAVALGKKPGGRPAGSKNKPK